MAMDPPLPGQHRLSRARGWGSAARARAIVLAEVASEAGRHYLPYAANVSVTWLPRNGAQAGAPDLLLPMLAGLNWPPGGVHAWMTGEIWVISRLREHLIAERGLERDRIRVSGYWRRGEAAAHERLED